MYIEPNTNIRIIKNCPLDPTYDHTIYWNDVADQTVYFQGITKYNLTRQSYQRVQKGRMTVGVKAEDLYDCNYLMFQNTSFGDKWFYAFIKGVEYVNNVTSEITFEIDVMQTWFFDYNLGMCYVDREHSEFDNVGSNTVPEDLEQGPYVEVTTGQIIPNNWNALRIMMLTTFNPETGEAYSGEIQNGIFSGLRPTWYETPAEFKTAIQKIINDNKIDGVVAVYMCPFYTNSDIEFEISKQYSTINGYVPKNAKMFTAPYNVLHIYNGQQNMDFNYELFGTTSCKFTLRCSTIPEPIVQIIPQRYAGHPDEGSFTGDDERKLAVTHFPMCAFNVDVYKAYLAEYSARLPIENYQAQLGVARSMAGLLGPALMANPSGIVQGVSRLASSVLDVQALNAQRSDIATKPAEVRGTSNPNADWITNYMLFRYKKLCIKAEYARIIDDFFTMYGYATHRLKVPNRNSRPHWNYVKTVGCVLEGSVPADDVSHICSIYNNGITFWHHADEIGDYSLDNRPGVG